MQIDISTRHGQISQNTREKIIEKVERLPRFFERITAVDVIIDLKHRESPQVEVRVSAELSHDFVAAERSGTVLSGIDCTVHKLEQQLRRHKEKLKGHRAIGLKHHEVPVEPETDVE